jgi:hypothetical protein
MSELGTYHGASTIMRKTLDWNRSRRLSICSFFGLLGRGETESTRYLGPLFGLLYQPRMMYNECGAVGGTSGRRNRSSWRKPATGSIPGQRCGKPATNLFSQRDLWNK